MLHANTRLVAPVGAPFGSSLENLKPSPFAGLTEISSLRRKDLFLHINGFPGILADFFVCQRVVLYTNEFPCTLTCYLIICWSPDFLGPDRNLLPSAGPVLLYIPSRGVVVETRCSRLRFSFEFPESARHWLRKPGGMKIFLDTRRSTGLIILPGNLHVY